jgi:hypothetical protein
MSEIRDGFLASLDTSTTGLSGYMKRIDDMLKRHEYKLWVHFSTEDIDHTYYAMKWVVLLMT